MTNARVFDTNGPDLVTVQDWDNMVPTEGFRMSRIRHRKLVLIKTT